MERFEYDGFEFEATAYYDPPERSWRGGWVVEVGEITITNVYEIIQAYGIKEAFEMGKDLETWIYENEETYIIEKIKEDY